MRISARYGISMDKDVHADKDVTVMRSTDCNGRARFALTIPQWMCVSSECSTSIWVCVPLLAWHDVE